jgi:hypothetical protein
MFAHERVRLGKLQRQLFVNVVAVIAFRIHKQTPSLGLDHHEFVTQRFNNIIECVEEFISEPRHVYD